MNDGDDSQIGRDTPKTAVSALGGTRLGGTLLGGTLLGAWALVLGSVWAPVIRLDSGWALGAVWLSEWGTKLAIVGALGASMALLVSRARQNRHPWTELIARGLLAVIVLGGGALANEFVIKPGIAAPRPNLEWLARAGILGTMSATEFHQMPGRSRREAFLRHALKNATLPEAVAPAVRRHWARTTGWSRPSGHATASFAALSFLFGIMGLTRRRPRPPAAMAMALWAVAICWARVLLRVHLPIDVALGALEGALLGGLGAAMLGWPPAPRERGGGRGD